MNPDDDLRSAQDRVERTQLDLIAVLERHFRLQDDPPKFSYAFSIHCLINLTGQLMEWELEDRGEDARPRLLTEVQHLALLVMPQATTPGH